MRDGAVSPARRGSEKEKPVMKLEVRNLALQAIELLRPIVVRIKKHDRSLARQITDAANSSVLNTGEGALSDPGTRRSRYQSAAGSANEVRVGVLAAIRWGYISITGPEGFDGSPLRAGAAGPRSPLALS